MALPPSKRTLTTRVKTARGRKSSSTRWLQRQLNDVYVQRAQEEGYKSRAAYKLIQIDDAMQLISPGSKIVDLGAAPGGWTQVALKRNKGGMVIGIDLQEMDPIDGAVLIQADFTTPEGLEALETVMKGEKVDLVMSDMAASSTGHSRTDHFRIIALCELAVEFALEYLAEGGHFVAKVLQGGTEKELLVLLKRHFTKVKHYKPDASRKDSAETYVVAKGFSRKDV